MTAPDPFTVGRVTLTRAGGTTASVKFPVTLHKGDVLRARVKFARPRWAAPPAGDVHHGAGRGRSPSR